MLKVKGNDIYLTRGDTAFIDLNLLDEDGDTYETTLNDKLYFRMKKTINSNTYILEKEIGTVSRRLTINESDTKDLKFGKYFYEIELVTEDNYHFTIIENANFEIGIELEIHQSEDTTTSTEGNTDDSSGE